MPTFSTQLTKGNSNSNSNGNNKIKIKPDKERNKERKILDDIVNKYNYCIGVIKSEVKKSKDNSDYINISITINTLERLFEGEEDKDKGVLGYVDNFIISHLFEELDLQKRVDLINKIQSYDSDNLDNSDDNDLVVIRLLKEYIDSLLISNEKIKFDIILLQNNNYEKDKKNSFVILVKHISSNTWTQATPSDINNIKKNINLIELYTVDISELNSHFGFFGIFRKNINVFKITDKESVKKTRHEHIGVNCSQSGQGKIGDKIEKLKSNILDKNDKLYNSDINEFFKQPSLCVLEELYLRYYDSIKKDDKRWFLSPIELLFSQEGLRKKL